MGLIFRRLVKGLAVLVACAALAFVALLGLLWQEQRTGIALPSPTGRFAVRAHVLFLG